VETTYNLIRPPFRTLKFKEISRKELKDYKQWFLQVVPQRVEELTRSVTNSPGFEDWKADKTPDSLNSLGNWFRTQVKTRTHTQEEWDKIPVHVREWSSGGELTDRTISLCMDVGMYLSQVFVHNHPSLKWDQIFGSKRFVDYGQPVLVGFGKAPFNPVRMMLTLAYGLAAKTKDGQRLRGIYDIWSNMIG
jgi:hypothetical protein